MIEAFADTSHGRIAYATSEGDGPTVLMIHGNSTCWKVFRNQLGGEVGGTYRCIAMDLPGHGASDDAIDTNRTYNMQGYAEAAIELMEKLGHGRYAVLGWSLGGHIALDMLTRSDALTGVMITGSPPIGQEPGSVQEGFDGDIERGLAAIRVLTDEEIDQFAHGTCGANAPYDPFLLEAVRRCDGRARSLMVAKLAAGIGPSQRDAAVNSPVPLAIVNGEKDPFIRADYIASLPYNNLWEDKVHILEGLDHAPFWEDPARFDPYLLRFLKSLES
jgi:pimeloyl-ACP methyl ester carboxylesterase